VRRVCLGEKGTPARYRSGEGSPAGNGVQPVCTWLRDVLAEPAALGSVIAMRHPLIPVVVRAMAIVELQDQDAFAEVVRGSDVRAVLAGHLHYSSWSTFAGVPVSVVASTCYTLATGAPTGTMRGVDGGQAFDLVHVYEDRIVHSVVPITAAEVAYELGSDFEARMESLDADGRREAFSRHSAARPPRRTTRRGQSTHADPREGV